MLPSITAKVHCSVATKANEYDSFSELSLLMQKTNTLDFLIIIPICISICSVDVLWRQLRNLIQPMYYSGNHGVSSEYLSFIFRPAIISCTLFLYWQLSSKFWLNIFKLCYFVGIILSKVTKPLTKTAAWMSPLVAKIEYVIMNSN